MPAAGPDAAAAPFVPDARVRHFENVCIHVGFKGTMSRQGYAWLESAADGSPRVPDQPHFSRHVDFIGSARELRSVRPWWRPSDAPLWLPAHCGPPLQLHCMCGWRWL